MKIIKPEEFPIEMTLENINILANMAMQNIISDEWREITLNLLTDKQNILINNRICEIQEEQEKIRWNSLTLEEQEDEKRKLKKSYNDTTSFRGNILEQERHSIDIENKRKKNNS
ncbi:hypothetical protein [Cellulophaga tyrosinoxydans]|uniref:Uncharacterized protein n=1 Tax=Cellulophaga tyrosinoxydans TaxID=504486 RepID=A0A1W1YSI2_9FLAO|nr:hypothetical protein [Cellulophaga tyrosinoxydans]SMC39175.1 hypothetical protein SAMN05660703_0838 [Cellulophaga tyrosinoxydans]